MECPSLSKKMTEWSFTTEPKLLQLPMDKERENFVRRHVPNAIFSKVWPTPFKNKPKLVCASSNALKEILDMDPEKMPEDEDFALWVGGNLVIEDSTPLAHRYGGYQFGYWVRTK